MHLFVFIFVMASLVFVVAFGDRAGPGAYVDALYFTVSTLTTTGFGDITLNHPGRKAADGVHHGGGRRPVPATWRAAIFQPSKVRYKCPECGLSRHDPDAIHCKHCGGPLKIETEGIGGT